MSRHATYIRTRLLPVGNRPRFIAGCDDCTWTYDAGTDRLDATGMAKVHAERAGRTVR